MKGHVQRFSDDATHIVNVTQEEMEILMRHRLKMDESTESTPSRRMYKYPHTWGRTRPSQDLLNEFREHGRVESFTTEEHTESREPEADEDVVQPPSPTERYYTDGYRLRCKRKAESLWSLSYSSLYILVS
jgi:kinesin family protein 11